MIDGQGRFLRESRRGFPDPVTALYKLIGLASLFPRSRVFARYHMGHLDPGQSHPTDVLAGAFFMVRREVLAQTGGFDESFFMYGEDIDLSYRIRQAGWENTYFAGCRILHFKGESTRKGSLDYLRMFYGAMAVFARKHYGRGRASLLAVGLQAGIWLRGGFSMAGSLLRKTATLFPGPGPESGKVLVMGVAPEKSLVDALESRHAQVTLTGHPPETHGYGRGTAKGIEQLAAVVRNSGCRELCCCANGLQYYTIIELAAALAPRLRLRIHATGSGSVAGSGESFPLEPVA